MKNGILGAVFYCLSEYDLLNSDVKIVVFTGFVAKRFEMQSATN